MRIGLSSAAFYGRGETEEQAAMLRDYPAQSCEIFMQTPSEYSTDFGALVREKLGDLPCRSVHPKGTQFEQDLFGRSARQVEDAMRLFIGVCDAGQALGARYYVFHGPFGVHAPLIPERIHNLQPTMARMQAIAAERGIEVLWENVHWCAVKNPRDVRAVREMLPEMGFVLDVKQAWHGGVDPFDMLEAMGDKLRHVHALDWTAEGLLCLPGQGCMDWKKLIRKLSEIGFDGDVMLEPYERHTRDAEAVRRSMEMLREIRNSEFGMRN